MEDSQSLLNSIQSAFICFPKCYMYVREGLSTLHALLQTLYVTVERGSKFMIFYILGKITKSFSV